MKKLNINGNNILRISIGIIYLWFGVLKFFPEVSLAEELAKSTISILTFGHVSELVAYLALAVWEVVIGIFLIFNFHLGYAVLLALVHMLGTFIPLNFYI